MTSDHGSPDTATARDPVEEMAEAFLERFRRGERPALSEFINQAPEHADAIRELFPALVLMEQASPIGSQPAARLVSAVRPERIGEYRIIREVGRGGMGVVYEAEQEALGRHVALKVLPLAAAGDAHCLLRFRREARAAAQLHHTNIVPVHDVGERDGVHFYAMQFIQGQALDEVIAELRRLRRPPGSPEPADGDVSTNALPGVAASLAKNVLSGHFPGENEPLEEAAAPVSDAPRAEDTCRSEANSSSVLNEQSEFSTKSDYHFYRSVARIGLQVADALAHAHAQRVLHRDIKPSNLLLDARGTVWVTDFGLAKEQGDDLTRTGDVVGTLRYMAPERYRGVSDARSDIYSLGLTLYELLTLRPAFPETDRIRLAHEVAHQEPRGPRAVDPRVPRDLETIVLKAITKEPAGRYATAEDLVEDLRRFLADRAILARRTSAWERVRRWCRRNPGWAATAAAVFLLLAIMAFGGTLLSWHLRQALNDVQTADREKTEKLWQSYLDRARALRSSQRIGRRFEALEAIREAARIKITPELRNEAAAALALADVELVREWHGLPVGTSSASYDASFSRYARLDNQGRLTVCRLGPSGEQIIARLPAPGPIQSIGILMSPDGRFLAHAYSELSAGGAGNVRIWNLDGPAPRVCLDEPRGMKTYHALSFHGDGRRLAIGHADRTVSVYDLETNAPPRRLALDQEPEGLAFHPRDGRLAVGCGESIRLFDTEAGRELPALRHAQIKSWWYGLAWHPGGRLLAATSEDRKIHLWDTESAKEAAAPLEGHTGSGIFMAFNDDGSRLFSAGWDRQARLWDTVSGELLLTIPGRFDAWLSRDGTLIGPERKGTMLRLWRVADGRELRSLRHPLAEPDDQLHHPVLHADGKVLAASSQRALNFFDLDSGRELASIPTTELGSACPRAFDHRDGWMTSGASGVLLWPTRYDPARPGVLRVGPPRKVASTIHSGSAASSDGRVRAIPLGTQTLVLDRDRPGRRLRLGPQYDVRHAAVSPDGRWVATCSWWTDGQYRDVQIWEADSGRHVVDLPAGGLATGLFSPDGRWLVVQSQDQACQLWEVGTWRAGRRFEGLGACWTPGGRLLAVNDVIGVIRLVQPASGREVLRLTGPHLAWDSPACFTPDGTRLIAAAADCRAFYVWDLRLIRTQLRALGMDWDLPEFPPAVGPRAADVAPTVEVELGIPRQPPSHPTP